MNLALLIAAIAALGGRAALAYELVQDYSGQTFFEGWDWYGNLPRLVFLARNSRTHTDAGDVWWLNETQATSQGLAYINSANNAIIKVDNTSNVAFNQKRNTVRITSQATYDIGSLWMIDLVSPPAAAPATLTEAFSSTSRMVAVSGRLSVGTFGPNWPEDGAQTPLMTGVGTNACAGEIDIIEGVNVMDNNQMARKSSPLPSSPSPPNTPPTLVHTTPGCFHPSTPTYESGVLGGTDCSTAAGCFVTEAQPNSYLSGFAAAGGGVWATQFDAAGIFIWFWSRANVPASITAAPSNGSLDISAWGAPSAAWPAGACNISEFFTAQNLVLDITLCGDWAGIGPVYNATCGSSGPTGLCYNDNVVGPGSPRYDEAYFEISYVRAYTTPVPSPTAPATGSASSAPAAIATTFSETGGGMGGSVVVVTGASAATATATATGGTSGGGRVADGWAWFGVVGVVGVMSGLVVVL
ncbi:hypothetical protein HWV62_11101 [Athelia sp. TMB]|nr:hypothetical protein HWV62_11101 [Athelia sp. TMB]